MGTKLTLADCQVARLGEAEFAPSLRSGRRITNDADRVLAYARVSDAQAYLEAHEALPSFEIAGRRATLYFDPSKVTAGIVTCGGLCPGQNDVIRSIVLTCKFAYQVRRVLGFRYGYAGLGMDAPAPPVELMPDSVGDIHLEGGTMLASSRGTPSATEMVDALEERGVNVLFTIGGDGTLRGASALAAEIRSRGLPTAVVAVPKTIDNDILWVEQSFGFRTAVEEARRAILGAHVEARGAWNGIGLVKLMGRQSGFIAAHACLANPDVNFCLVPEVPFALEGRGAFLEALEDRLRARHHAVIVVAEGAGPDLVQAAGTDASGNVKLGDIGLFLKERIATAFNARGLPTTIKYIDPSYIVRSLPANASDSKLCLMLGQHAVHAAMAGRTDLVIGYWNQYFTHVPIRLATAGRKQIEPEGDTWQAVLASTGQPASMMPA